MKKRLLALLLVILTVLPLCVACADDHYTYESYNDFIVLGDPKNIVISEKDIQNGILGAYQDLFADDITDKKLTATEVTSGEVRYGDTVKIDYKGYKIGETTPFSGGTATDQTLEIGSGSYIEGFESGLIEHVVGETLRLYLTFPETYGSADLAGQRVYFDITIKSITKRYPDEYYSMTHEKSLDKIKDKTDYETLEEFQTETRKEVIKSLVWGEFFELCKVKKWPEAELRDYYDLALEQHKQTAIYLYGSFDSYAVNMGYADGNALRQAVLQQAKNQCKQDLMILASIEKFDIKFPEGTTIESEMQKLYEEAKAEGFKGSYKKYLKEYDESVVRISAYTDITLDYLVNLKSVNDNIGKTGFFTIKQDGANLTYYYVKGEKQLGWHDLDLDGEGAKAYFFDPALDGLVYRNVTVKLTERNGTEEKYHTFGDYGRFDKIVENGFIFDGKGRLYLVDSVPFVGKLETDNDQTIEGNEIYLFNADGYLLTGVQKLENITGIDFAENTGKYYDFGTSGIYDITKGLAGGENGAIIEYKYYKNGVLQTSTTYTNADNDVYYFDENGDMLTSKFIELNDNLYYFDNLGKMLKGKKDGETLTYAELQVADMLYKIDENGVVTSVTCTIKPETGDPVAQKSTAYTNAETNTTYYFDANGEMVRKQLIDNVTIGEVAATRYFNELGEMVKAETAGQTVEIEIGGARYSIDENGVATLLV